MPSTRRSKMVSLLILSQRPLSGDVVSQAPPHPTAAAFLPFHVLAQGKHCSDGLDVAKQDEEVDGVTLIL